MRTTTADYKAAIYATDRECRGYIKFNNDGTKIIRGVDGLISITLHEQLCDEERPMINCACSRYVEVEFFNSGLPGGVSLANSYIDTYMGVVTKDTGTAPIGSIEPDTKTVEYIWNGRFYIDEINRGKQTTKVTAYDEFAKLNKEYVPTVTKGVSGYSMNDILVDVLTQCNFVVHTGGISGYVQEIPQCTCMQMVGWLIGKATLGSNAKMSRANANNIQSTTLKTQWTHRDDADHAVTDNEIYLGGLADGDAFTITSVTTGMANNPIVAGSGTGVVGESPYLDSADAASILSDITGITFKPMTIEFRGNPAIDTCDVLKVTNGGTSNYCWVQRLTTTFNGGIKQKIECFGDSEFYYSTEMNPTTTQIKNAVSSMAQEIQQEIETADNGVITKVLDLDGSWKELVIANNQDLSAATSVWRWNINGLAHSTAYSGGTYNFAVDMNGRIIADVIQTGILTDAQGKNSWNLDTGALTITNGTVNITTSSAYDDLIQLKSGNYAVSIQPQAVTAANSGNFASLTQLGLRMERNPATVVGILNAGSFNVIDGSTYNDRLLLNYSSGLTFYNSSGTVTATYPATGLQKLTGATDSTTATGCVYAVPPQTFSSASTQQDAAEALLKYICANYPNKTSCTFIGNYITTANRRGYELYVSSTSSVNANGIPQYASGIVYEASTTMMVYSVNVSNYVTYLSYTLPRISTTETSNLNNCTENGLYYYTSAASNNPTGTGGTILSTKFNTVYSGQLLFGNSASDDGARLYYRRKNTNGWQALRGIMTLKTQSVSEPYNESVIDYVANSGTTRTYTLKTAHTYLVTVARRNTTATDKDGLWICAVHSTNSHLTAVKSPGVTYTISVSSTTLSITTWDNYMNISILDLGGY